MRLDCTRCRREIAREALRATGAIHCPECRAELRVWLFPAILSRPAEVAPDEAGALSDESTCFFHERRRASVVCDACGRFLCGLCDIELGHRHLCPGCIGAGRRKGEPGVLDAQRIRYDQVVLALALLPMLFFYFTLLTAPAVLLLTVWFWRAPRSLVQPRPTRFIVAAILAVLQIVGWVGLISYLVRLETPA